MKKNVYYGTGKRKGSIAKVTLVNGTGKITVNGVDVFISISINCVLLVF